MLLEQSVWDTTREGVQRQLAEATDRAMADRTSSEIAQQRALELEAQCDTLTQRIIELEQKVEASSDDIGENGDQSRSRDRDIREYISRINELQSQLHISECQNRIEISKMRQQLRQNSAVVALAKTEAAECRMVMDLYR